MKISRCFIAYSIALCSLCFSKEIGVGGFTDEEVAKMRASVPESEKSYKTPLIIPKQDSSAVVESPSLLVQIGFDGQFSNVLKSSILVTPKPLMVRMAPASGSTYLPLQEFMVRHRGWISTFEVTENQRLGLEPLSESAQKMLEATSNIVIATMNGNPVSFKKYQPK
jgi:hypothetical protein